MKNKERIEKNMDEQEMRITHARKIHAGGVQNTAILSERGMLSREDSIFSYNEQFGKKRGECL